MKQYLVRVTESINHDYLIEADNADNAVLIYESYNSSQLRELDLDGEATWDKPWDAEETTQ